MHQLEVVWLDCLVLSLWHLVLCVCCVCFQTDKPRPGRHNTSDVVLVYSRPRASAPASASVPVTVADCASGVASHDSEHWMYVLELKVSALVGLKADQNLKKGLTQLQSRQYASRAMAHIDGEYILHETRVRQLVFNYDVASGKVSHAVLVVRCL
jgi:hypothetical protein